jgi:hypothetical protein
MPARKSNRLSPTALFRGKVRSGSRLLQAAIIGVFLLIDGQECLRAQVPPLEMSVSIPAEVTLFEPVIATIRIANRSSRTWTVAFGEDFVTNFRFGLTAPDGAESSVRPEAGEFGSGIVVIEVRPTVFPGATKETKVVLNRSLQFETAGRYVVSFTYEGVAVSGGSTVPAGSLRSSAAVRVTPYDAQRLRAVWATLTQQATVGSPQRFLLEALATVKDPVAIPYLVEVSLSRPGFSLIPINGLVRIGTTGSRDALRSLAESGNADVRLNARVALDRFVIKSR